MRDLAVVAAQPHPIGSAANGAVRDYLLAEIAKLGLAGASAAHDGERDFAAGGDRAGYAGGERAGAAAGHAGERQSGPDQRAL